MSEQPEGAVVDRPYLPKGYGIETSSEGLLPWEWVSDRVASARNYWIATTRPDGRPHCIPVWGIWLDDAVIFSTARATRKGKNLEARPDAVIHLESGDEVVILEGRIEERQPDDRIADPYEQKYGIRPPLDDPANAVFALRPKLVLAWREKDFPSSATRWRFD